MLLKVIININHSSLKNVDIDINQHNDMKKQKTEETKNYNKIEEKKINPLDLI